jgi:hypothetical protein
MTQINWQYQVNNRAGGYVVTATDWNDFAGNFRALIDQTTGSGTTDNSPLPIGIDLVNDRVYISDPDSTTPEDANHADTTLSVVGTTTLAGNTQQTGTFTVGVDDTGHDVKFYGATASSYMRWAESADVLQLNNSSVAIKQDDGYPILQLESYNDTEAATGRIAFYKADGTQASPQAVDDDATLGQLRFYGYDGNSYAYGAFINVLVDGTPGDGDMPTEMQFGVTPDGSETPATAITIKPTGETRFTADNDITDFTADNHGVISLYNSDGAVDDFTCLDFIGNGVQAAARIGMKYTSGGSQLVFGTSNSYAAGVNNESVLITAAGYLQVGDGTTAYTLDANMNGPIRFNWASYTGSVIGNTTGMFIGHNSSSRVMSLVTNETERLRIGGSGKVCIRDDATPGVIGARLVTLRSQTAGMVPLLAWAETDVDASTPVASIFMIGVNGDSSNPGTGDYWALFRRGNGTTIGSIRGTGSASVNFSTTSDQTMKNDLGDAGDVSSIIDDIKIHKYTWKDADSSVGTQIGVFAQEVLAISDMPNGIAQPAHTKNEVVETTIDEDGNEVETKGDVYYPASIDYGKLVPLLVQEIKSLRVRVAALEA